MKDVNIQQILYIVQKECTMHVMISAYSDGNEQIIALTIMDIIFEITHFNLLSDRRKT
jgi:hypothetical protein